VEQEGARLVENGTIAGELKMDKDKLIKELQERILELGKIIDDNKVQAGKNVLRIADSLKLQLAKRDELIEKARIFMTEDHVADISEWLKQADELKAGK